MKRFLILVTVGAWLFLGQPVAAAAVTSSKVPGYPNITMYRANAAQQALPSFWENFSNLFRLPSSTKMQLPFDRSVAVLVGVGNYKFITPRLEYISKDVEKLRDYLLGDGGFDAVYVIDESVSPQVVDTFMSDVVPTVVGPNDRLMFYYSGHGADPGSGRPVLQFQQAHPGHWGQDVLRVDEYEQWSNLIKAKHVLFLYDACAAGEATIPKAGTAETRTAISSLSGTGSRIVVTAGTAAQQAWVVQSEKAQYSIFTETLLRVLRNGTSESKARGFITIEQAVAEATNLVPEMTRQEMNPNPVKIDRKYTGTFVFLYPMAAKPSLPQDDIVAMGVSVPKGADPQLEKEMEFAAWKTIEPLDDPQLYAKFCQEYPAGILCAAARKKIELRRASTPPVKQDLTKLSVNDLKRLGDSGSSEALLQLGKVL